MYVLYVHDVTIVYQFSDIRIMNYDGLLCTSYSFDIKKSHDPIRLNPLEYAFIEEC